jgi:hypothetical protein
MKFLAFSFKNEAMWTIIFALGPVVAGVFVLLLVYLVRSLI